MSDCSETYPNTVMIICRDMKASVAFYRDQLGFELKEAWPTQEDPHWANLVMDKQSLMLSCNTEPEGEACEHDPAAAERWKESLSELRGSTPGAGVYFYLMVPDVDAYYAEVTAKGVATQDEPKNQFYGLRDFPLRDPDGYRFQVYQPIQMESCQSCAMPLAEAAPGQMYCGHCTDDAGQLRSYEQVFEGTVTGYFMGMQKMERAEAEAAAREHLAKMPAWMGREVNA